MDEEEKVVIEGKFIRKEEEEKPKDLNIFQTERVTGGSKGPGEK
jgi:hypothetical protein